MCVGVGVCVLYWNYNTSQSSKHSLTPVSSGKLLDSGFPGLTPKLLTESPGEDLESIRLMRSSYQTQLAQCWTAETHFLPSNAPGSSPMFCEHFM
jgi:hypothetical protein